MGMVRFTKKLFLIEGVLGSPMTNDKTNNNGLRELDCLTHFEQHRKILCARSFLC